MGAEFLGKTKNTIIKHIDAKRVALATPDFFTKVPTDEPRCAIATISVGATVKDGDLLIVESRNGSVDARRGNSIVAKFDNPTSDLVAAIGKSGGAANGIAKRVHKISKKVEVSLC
ncbi:hypothetical protein [Mesorhizobium sp. ES1-4]|uniref:hypothetical protein n=1 Tax=Mesorhizobium sp. ES1-4 TaxID=2876627 RepID=UPI001CCFDB67|nr:hypothetical protein [Mesorhizobium sp. ES1-4]MBZ9799710.1 hypothetical protein [Mesorhizobium sp. ES1-4]